MRIDVLNGLFLNRTPNPALFVEKNQRILNELSRRGCVVEKWKKKGVSMRYEMIREIFNKCSGNQMRDVFVSNVETDDPEAYVRNMLKGKEVSIWKDVLPDGTICLDVDIAGLKQRFSFTED